MQSGKRFPIKFHGETYEIMVITGILADSKARAETHVSGVIGDAGGTVSSKTTLVSDYFLINETGEERHLKAINFELPARAGHRLAFAYISPADQDDPHLFFGYNSGTKTKILNKKVVRKLIGIDRVRRSRGWSIVAVIVSLLLATSIQFFWLLLLICAARMVLLFKRTREMEDELDNSEDLSNILNHIVATTNASPQKQAAI